MGISGHFSAHFDSFSLKAPASQALGVFTSVVVIVSVGSLVVTIQAKVCSRSAPNIAFYRSSISSYLEVECTYKHESGSMHIFDCPQRSFFQGLCVLGYCVAPLDIAALISYFVRIIWVRVPVALAAWAWCIWGNLTFFLLYCSPLTATKQPL